jgi:hypothetical protein
MLLKPLIKYNPYTLTYIICLNSRVYYLIKSRNIFIKAYIIIYIRHTALNLTLICINIIFILIKEFNKFNIF